MKTNGISIYSIAYDNGCLFVPRGEDDDGAPVDSKLKAFILDAVLRRFDIDDGRWSIHPPGFTDEQIRKGRGILASGDAERVREVDKAGRLDYWSRPTVSDYRKALAEYEARTRRKNDFAVS